MRAILFWVLVGSLLGFAAANKKGFAPVAGILAGALLGPFAVLLFLVSGILSPAEHQRRCPHCAEWIAPEATVCKHCHKEIAAATSS